MSSILKVDTIQDQSGNNIINESGNVITIGASGDTITVPAGATVSGFTSAGIDDNATSTAITISSDEDVTFTEDIKLADNKIAIFGASSDLQIFHSSTSGNSFIKDVGAGMLILGSDGTGILLQKTDGETMGKFLTDGAVELYHNNVKKFETTSAGATVTGTLTTGAITSTGNFTFNIADGMNINTKESLNINIDTDDNDSSRVFAVTSGSGGTSETLISASEDAGVRLYYDNSNKFETTSSGVTVTGDATITKNDTPLYLNRTGSDGEVLRVSKDGTQIGYLGNISAELSVTNATATNGAGICLQNNLFVTPMKGGSKDSSTAVSLGNTSFQWKDIYLGGGAFIGGTGTANKLDDYEEGTWTPTYRGSSSAGSYSANASGTYTKVGNLVQVTCHLKNITENSAGSGSIQIAGLPFAKSSAQESDIGSIYLNLFVLGSSGSHEYAVVNVNPGVSHVLITAIDSNGGSASTLQLSARVSDASDMFFSVTYTT